jgi:hypothetical protein
MAWCGPILLGESFTPVGAKTRFPALRLGRAAGNQPEIRIVGSTPFAWRDAEHFDILAITTSDAKFEERELARPMLEPLLFYLGLLANCQSSRAGISSLDWLARRCFRLHLSSPKGLVTWTYPDGLISPEEALTYLTRLAQDFLDPSQLDLLPLDVIATENLRRGYAEHSPLPISPGTYRELLENRIAEAREKAYVKKAPIPFSVDLAGARVPDDALAKARRRFGLLDRGPAKARGNSAPEKPPRKRTRKAKK